MRYLLVLVILVIAASDILGIEIGLAPGLSVKNGLLYLAFGLLLIQRAVTRQPRLQLSGLQALFLCMIAYALATIIFNVVILELPRYNALQQFIVLKAQYVDYFAVFIVFFYAARSDADVDALLPVLLGAVAAGALFTITNVMGLTDIGPTLYGDDNEIEGGRVHGYFGHANETGTLMIALIPAFMAMAEQSRGARRAAWLLGLACCAMMLLMTGSRSAMLGLLFGGGATAYLLRSYFSRKRVMRWAGLFLLVLVPMLLVFGAPYLETLGARISSQAAGNVADASSGRTELWGEAFNAMMEKPWTFITGYGWGGWDHHNFRFVAHNQYLSYLFELGLLGAIGFVVLIIGTCMVARRALGKASPRSRALLIAYVIGMASLAVSVFFVNLYKPMLYVWMFAGLCMRLAVNAHAASGEKPTLASPAVVRGAGVVSAIRPVAHVPLRSRQLR